MDTFAWRYCKYVRLATLPLISAKNNTLHSGCGFSWRSQTSIASDDTAAALIMTFARIAFSRHFLRAALITCLRLCDYLCQAQHCRLSTTSESLFTRPVVLAERGRHQLIAAPGTGVQRYTHVCMIPSSLFMGLIHLTLLALTLLPPGLEGRSSAFPQGRAGTHHAHDERKAELMLPCLKLHASFHRRRANHAFMRPSPLACLGHHCTAAPAATGHELDA